MQEFWIHVVNGAMNAFSFLPMALLLGIAVILLALMHRLHLLRRPHHLHALFVFLYNLYLPAVFLLLGFTWAMIGTFEQAFLAACDQSQKSIRELSLVKSEAAMEEIHRRFPENSSPSLKELSQAITLAYIRQYKENTDLASLPEYVRALLAPLVAPMQETFAQGLAARVEEGVIREAAVSAALTPAAVRGVWEKDVLNALRDGLAVAVLKERIRAFFPPYYQNVRFLLVVSVLPIAAEIGLTFLVLALLRRFRARRGEGKT
jgi:hypothetical protein